MNLSALVNRHPGSDVWVIGTAPSLDLLDDSMLGDSPRILINRAAFALPVMPGATYWLVADDAWALGVPGPWRETLDSLIAGTSGMIGVFRNPLMTPDGGNPPPAGDSIVTWQSGTKPRLPLLSLSREDCAARGLLYQYSGTAAPAIHLAHLMGAARVRLVGCDGGDGYARRLAAYYDRPARGGLGYQMPRHDALRCAATINIELDDWTPKLQESQAHANF